MTFEVKIMVGWKKFVVDKDFNVDEWKLVIPENIYNLKNGVMEDAAI